MDPNKRLPAINPDNKFWDQKKKAFVKNSIMVHLEALPSLKEELKY